MAERTKPHCQNCGSVATNLVAFRPASGGLLLWLSCDGNACLERARKEAADDDNASITRIRNSAALFYRAKPAGPPDHQPPFICAACRARKHQHCPNQVPIRRDGALVIVTCDCLADRHGVNAGVESSVT